MTSPRRALLLVIASVIAILIAGCSRPGAAATDDPGVPYPAGCADFKLTDRQCTAIVDEMAAQTHVDRTLAQEILLLGDPGCGFEDPHVLCTRTMSFVVRVRFVLEDGTTAEASQFCGVGGMWDIRCGDPPQIRLSSATLGGYHDVPCAGEPPDGCATPVPNIDPATAADARPLRIDALDIPIDRLGAYDVPLGTAVLPNGILTDATFSLVDDRPTDLLLATDGINLALRSLDGGGDFWNIYDHGWRPGVERVEARLVFDVAQFDPGATLQVRGISVR